MKTILSAPLLAAMAAFSASTQAQQVVQSTGGPTVRTVPFLADRPVVHVHFDVAQDRVTSIQRVPSGRSAVGSPPCFDNSMIADSITYVVTDPGQELLNWGRKNCDASARLRRITLLYLSEAVPVEEGGPGATLQFSLFTGTNGFGRTGTEIYRRTFTGLPSHWQVSPLTYLTLDFGASPLPLVDGNFGWGFLQLDGDTGPVLVHAPRPALGTVDAMDIYSPGPARRETYLGTFNYGGSFPPANTFIQVDEIGSNEFARTTVVNGSGTNPLLLQELFPPRIGNLWAARVDVPNPCPGGGPCGGDPDFTVLFTSMAALATPLRSPFGEFLIDRALPVAPPMFAEGTHLFSIPLDHSLSGRVIYAQAAVLPDALPTITLTNALRLVVGY